MMSLRRTFRDREMKHSTREALLGYSFVGIWIIGFALFTVVPLFQTFLYSLNQVTVTATGIDLDYVSLVNYSRALFTDPNFVELLISYARPDATALRY